MKDVAPANLLIELVTTKLKLLRDSSRLSSWTLLQKIQLSERGNLGELPPDPALFGVFVADVKKSIQAKASERLQSVELEAEWKPFAAILAIKSPKAAALKTTSASAASAALDSEGGGGDNPYAAYALALKEPLKQLTKGRRLGEQRAARSSATRCVMDAAGRRSDGHHAYRHTETETDETQPKDAGQHEVGAGGQWARSTQLACCLLRHLHGHTFKLTADVRRRGLQEARGPDRRARPVHGDRRRLQG